MSNKKDTAQASCENAVMRPLPEEYPYTEVTCECKGERSECRTCNGLGIYYLYKRIKGQWLEDEESPYGLPEEGLGDKPNW